MMCALVNGRLISGTSASPGPSRSATEPVSSTSAFAPFWKSTSMKASSLGMSTLEQVRFGEHQLGLGVDGRTDVPQLGALPAHDGEELAILLLEQDHLEGEMHHGAQAGVVPRLLDEAVDLAFV